ncbi:thermonuclease family protein [Antarctobacter jejuensis]|uniref:thermonuclease family protein n=1 Tax=Antarctobacter jejuensis TaxID=1439938 RepID=UPI003FD2D164
MAAADIAGPLRVVDGDTLVVGDTRIRLHGIDALERDQMCGGKGGYLWPCGAWVTGEVRARYEGRWTRCVALDTDHYGRVVARCSVGGDDMGAALVESGLAFAYRKYSEAYVPQERRAAQRKAGLHATGVHSPASFRALKRDVRSARIMASAPEGCVIKGNISQNSGRRIYHLPGQDWYAKTKITATRGERWFCSEEEARAAGWQRAAR